MTRRSYLLTCAECGEATTSMTLICGRCAPKYEDALMGDECGCPSCRSETLRIPQPAGLQRMQFVEFNEVQP